MQVSHVLTVLKETRTKSSEIHENQVSNMNVG